MFSISNHMIPDSHVAHANSALDVRSAALPTRYAVVALIPMNGLHAARVVERYTNATNIVHKCCEARIVAR